LPDKIPGLQLSHGFAYGKVNKNDSIPVPDYIANLFMLSSESKFHKLTAQYHIGTGDFEENMLMRLQMRGMTMKDIPSSVNF
jgi:hypothetical protein